MDLKKIEDARPAAGALDNRNVPKKADLSRIEEDCCFPVHGNAAALGEPL